MNGERLCEVAARHGVCTRTIRRDLQALREAGYGFTPWTEQDVPGDIGGAETCKSVDPA